MDGRAVLTSIHTAFYLSAAFATYYDPESARYDHDAAATLYTALIIGHAMGMARDQLVSVQRIAGSFGLDTNQTAVGEVTDWKHCTYASCVLRGLEAVKLARSGFEAASEIYKGAAGINRFFPHAEASRPAAGARADHLQAVAGAGLLQTPIDVAIDIAAQVPDKNAIRSISVKTYAVPPGTVPRLLPGIRRPAPGGRTRSPTALRRRCSSRRSRMRTSTSHVRPIRP